MAKVNEGELAAYRTMDCAVALPLLTDHCKQDRDFTALKNVHTNRWHVSVGGRDFEILTTGAKWFDTRASVGGGGAIDLCMHLHNTTFKLALAKLRSIVK